MQCSHTSTNISNNFSAPQIDQRILYADLLVVYKTYIGFGSFAVATNIICVLVVLSKSHMREKYGNFGLLSFGDLINSLGMVLAGTERTRLISNNLLVNLNSFQCLGQPWPCLFIVGGQLPAFVLLMMGSERLLAVSRPLFYRTYITARTRIIANSICVLLSVMSLLIGILTSFLNRNLCTSPACTVAGTTGRAYGYYNYVTIIIIPTIALFLNCIGYFKAHSMTSNANMRRELRKVLATLVIAALAVILSAIPNVILWGQGIFWNIQTTTISLFYIGFCCNSAVDLFVFTLLKRDFRYRLLAMFSNGFLNRYFKLPEVMEAGVNQRIGQNIPVRHVSTASETVDRKAMAHVGRNPNPARVRFQDAA